MQQQAKANERNGISSTAVRLEKQSISGIPALGNIHSRAAASPAKKKKLPPGTVGPLCSITSSRAVVAQIVVHTSKCVYNEAEKGAIFIQHLSVVMNISTKHRGMRSSIASSHAGMHIITHAHHPSQAEKHCGSCGALVSRRVWR